MQAIRVHDYGELDLLILETVAIPEPQPNEVLIRVQAAGVNPLDWKIRAGYMKEIFPMPLPFTPGMDVAGTVEAVGADVKAFQVGQAVYGELKMGAYAEFATAPQDAIALKPKTLDFVQAASVPMVAMTAYQALFDYADLKSGQTILIHAASGGVGMFAVRDHHQRHCPRRHSDGHGGRERKALHTSSAPERTARCCTQEPFIAFINNWSLD